MGTLTVVAPATATMAAAAAGNTTGFVGLNAGGPAPFSADTLGAFGAGIGGARSPSVPFFPFFALLFLELFLLPAIVYGLFSPQLSLSLVYMFTYVRDAALGLLIFRMFATARSRLARLAFSPFVVNSRSVLRRTVFAWGVA